VRERSERVCNLPAGSSAAKVRQASASDRRLELSADATAALDAVWGQTMTAEFGLADYSALREALPNRPGLTRDR
jgi:hypothetical protein